jgi:large subunit ribosomal protein L32e
MIMEKKNKPKFNVPNAGFFKSIKTRWRKPRGTHNKKRMKFQFMGASPKVGYRNPVAMRDLHPSGKREVMVSNPKDVENLKDVVLRIAGAVGGKKRKQIEEKAKALHLRIVNMVQPIPKEGAKKAKWVAKEPSKEGRVAANAVKSSKSQQKAEAKNEHKHKK